jgi:UDP-N-acetylmuramoyl-tripeptide--D-alanyl-D-alanine ligase
MLDVALGLALAAAFGLNALRWLRVAQREHYLPGSVTLFASRWIRLDFVYGAALVLVSLAVILTGVDPGWLSLLVVIVAAVGPVGLSYRGATSKLAWTDRIRRVGLTAVVASGVFVAAAWALGGSLLLGLSLVVLLVPALIDLALALLKPLEARSQRQWIDKAQVKMRSVGPQVVAITGSYGKTTTKEYAKRVLSAGAPTLASPASFNNAMGLARTVNEHLAPGTKWFIAEMGTYGPGEISELCSWIPPDIAAITAIGPVHLERFKSLEITLRAKAEITERARVVVLNIDDPLLSSLADELEATGKTVIRCSANDRTADAAVIKSDGGWVAFVAGEQVGVLPELPFGSNLAVAIGLGIAAGSPMGALGKVFEGAVTPDHRQSLGKGAGGAWIIDDTFNSNPAGAQAALDKLASLDVKRRVVVTPGMVELGPQQVPANSAFARRAGDVADDLMIVKRTNRKALLAGTKNSSATVRLMKTRDEAVEWVRSNLGEGDAVLYENDLPDHYA